VGIEAEGIRSESTSEGVNPRAPFMVSLPARPLMLSSLPAAAAEEVVVASQRR